jgi:hypothetical protein
MTSGFSSSFCSGILLLLALLLGTAVGSKCDSPCVPGDDSIMRPKEHGTSHTPVQTELRWGCDNALADRICNYNRHFAENSGYWEDSTSFLADESGDDGTVTFYDSNTGAPLFTAPVGRTWLEFVTESRKHGWPSFRDKCVFCVLVFC